MKRRTFVQAITAGAALTVVNPINLLDLLIPRKDIILPFVDGPKTVTLLAPKKGMIAELRAQVYQTPYGYHSAYSYGNMAPYQQWYAYQQALIRWQQQVQYWQQQQYMAWLTQQHYQRMQALLNQYQNYQIGAPEAWPAAKSIYGFARDINQNPTLIGVNKNAQPVKIDNTLKGAAKIFEQVNDHYGKDEAEKAVGPQSSESLAMITLPNNSQLKGKFYQTSNGALGVSDPDQLVRSADGTVGQLGKYVTGPDGQQYTVI